MIDLVAAQWESFPNICFSSARDLQPEPTERQNGSDWMRFKLSQTSISVPERETAPPMCSQKYES